MTAVRPAAQRPTSESHIHIAVVGHTNTGKTSLIRTLLRNHSFGTVADAASTTRHVERATIVADSAAISFYDTPGLEDATALLELLTNRETQPTSESPRTALRAWLENIDASPDFAQEAKVLRQGLKSDALLYVIDVRQPLLEKYSDEIAILGKLGKPIIPVFNFVTGNTRSLQRWRELMIGFNLHAALEFDTVAFDFEAEKRLYQKLQSVLEPHYQTLQAVIDWRSQDWQQLTEAAIRRVVELVAQTAIVRVERQSTGDGDNALQQLQTTIRRQEQACLRDLLSLFAFTSSDVKLLQLPVRDGVWELDLFSVNTLKMFSLNAGSSALKGAAAGAGLDLMTGGLSLGVATLLGAALGAGYSTAKRYGKDISARLLKNDWACADDLTVELVYLRGQYLLRHLLHRGHASQHTLTVSAEAPEQAPEQTPKQASVQAPEQAPEQPSRQTPDSNTDRLPEQWQAILRDLRSGQVNTDSSNSRYQRARQHLHDSLQTAVSELAGKA